MGKNRGFKPQGMINAIPRIKPTGPSMIERIQRESRPTWDQLRKLASKKEASSSEAMEKWENENYQLEMTKVRDDKRSKQERLQLLEVKKEAKRSRKLRKQMEQEEGGKTSDRSEGSTSSSDDERKKRRKREKSEKSRHLSRKEKSKKDEKKRSKHRTKEKRSHNPYKLSDFLKLTPE